MMKKKNRFLALLLCLVMLLGCLSGCGKKEDDTQKEDPKQEQSGTQSGTQKEDPATPAEPEIPLGTLPLVPAGEKATLTIGIKNNPNTENYDTNELTLWLEEQTGIDLEFVYFSNDNTECNTQLAMMVASGEKLPDILFSMTGVTHETIQEYGRDGYLIDLAPYMEKYSYWQKKALEDIDPTDRENLLARAVDPATGGIYGLPQYNAPGNDQHYAHNYINKKWLDAVGAEVPTTVEELYDVLVKFKKAGDLNGNGKVDEFPITGFTGYCANIHSWLVNPWVYCVDDINHIFNVTDGKVWTPYNTDEYRQALIFMNKLVSEGLMPASVFTIARDDTTTYKAIATPADQVPITGVINGHLSLIAEKDNPVIYEYTSMGPLAAETDKGGYAPVMASTVYYHTAITADCKDPVLAFRLLDFMCSDEAYTRSRYGTYGRDWVEADPGAVSSLGKPATIKVLDSSVYNKQNNVNWHVTFSAIKTTKMAIGQYVDDGSWSAIRNRLAKQTYDFYESGAKPTERFANAIYNEEEQEVVSELRKIYRDYALEARGLFATGVLDPSNDTDWNNYLEELKKLGEDDLLKVAQSAYTRMMEG